MISIAQTVEIIATSPSLSCVPDLRPNLKNHSMEAVLLQDMKQYTTYKVKLRYITVRSKA